MKLEKSSMGPRIVLLVSIFCYKGYKTNFSEQIKFNDIKT